MNRKLRNIVMLEKALVNRAYHKKYTRSGLRVSLDRDKDYIVVKTIYTNHVVYRVAAPLHYSIGEYSLCGVKTNKLLHQVVWSDTKFLLMDNCTRCIKKLP